MRILFVAIADHIHTARWINQLDGTGWDIHLYDAKDKSPHPILRNVTYHAGAHLGRNIKGITVRYRWPFPYGKYFMKTNFPRAWRQLVPDNISRLESLIRKLKPDCVHSLNMQNESYPLYQAKQKLGSAFRMPWIYSSWGSDIYLYGRYAEHQPRIREVLQSCNYIFADCKRDISLARKFGFKGESLGVFPCGGGYQVEALQAMRQPGLTSQRRVIAVKGYQHWAGRGLNALDALRLCADVLRGYKVVIHSAYPEVEREAQRLSSDTGLNVEIMPRSSHEEMFKLFGSARIAIGINSSDGTPQAMLEALIMGAFPIQSDTSGASDWIDDAFNGSIVPYDDIKQISNAIRKAVTDDKLVDTAAIFNIKLALERLDAFKIRDQVIKLYKRIHRSKELNNGVLYRGGDIQYESNIS